MTREEAIKQIEAFRTCMIVDDAEQYVVEALNIAIQALEQEPCEDGEEARARWICCPMCDKKKCKREADDCDVKIYLKSKARNMEL